jgi:hypothetical protein
MHLRLTNHDVVYAVLLCVFSCAPGCSDGLPKRVPVSGKVLIDGKPVTSGNIRMTPVAGGRMSAAQISGDGGFTMTTFKIGDGCVLGKHVVTIYSYEDINETTRRWHVPKSYSMPAKSGLAADIEGPTDSLEFNLTWGGKKSPEIEKLGG